MATSKTTVTTPEPDPGLPYRKPLLALMQGMPDNRFSFPALLAQLQTRFPELTDKALQPAIAFQFKRGNINFEFDHDIELDVWFPTTRGKEAK